MVAKSVKLKRLIKTGLWFRFTCAAACKVTATLVVRIAKKSRAKVRRLKGKKLTLRFKVTSSGKTTTLTRTVKLKR